MAEHTVYAVASGKGGVGKTTTTVNLGAALAEQGHSVALVDADLGMANLGGYLGVGEEGRTLHEVLAGEADLEDAIYEVSDGLAVVPSGISLNGFANVETAALSDAVDSLEGAFDYVLLDLGAGMSHDSVLPLALADAVLLVSTPNKLALQDTAKTREVTERLGGAVAGTVLTRARDPTGIDLDAVAEQIGIPVLAVIPEDQAVQEGTDDGRPVVGYDPDSPAAEGYRGLAEIVIEESLANAPVVPDRADPAGPPAAETGAGETAATGSEGGAAAEAPSDAGGESQTDTEAESPSDVGAESSSDTEAESSSDADAEPPSDAPAESPPEPEPAEAGAEPDAEAETGTEPAAEPAGDPSGGAAGDQAATAAADTGDETAPERADDPSDDQADQPAVGQGGEAPAEPPQGDPEPADTEVDQPTAAQSSQAAGSGQPAEESAGGGRAGGDLDDRDLVPEQERDAEDIAAAIEEAASVSADAGADADEGLTFEETDAGGGDDVPAEEAAAPVGEDKPEPAFSVEGAEPQTDDEEEEESSGGLLSRLFGV